MKKSIEDLEWDKRKIAAVLLFMLLAGIIAFELRARFLPNRAVLGEKTLNKSEIKKPEIKSPNINLQEEAGSKINEIKKNINELDPESIASSSPQIQKVLRDISGIREIPSNQAKEMCLKICGGL